MKAYNLTEQLELAKQGEFIDGNGSTDCHNFYDWWCKDTSLEKKAEALFKRVDRFVKEFNIDTENTYCFFKNNCPMNGGLYDDFRISDLKTGEVLWCVVPKCGHARSGKAQIWNIASGSLVPVYEAKTLTEIYKSINK